MSLLRALPLLVSAASLALVAGCAEAAQDDAVATNDAITDDAKPAGVRSAVGTLVDASSDAARCTGTLISTNVVLTSADCITGSSKLDFVVGEGESAKHFAAASTQVHPGHVAGAHDLAYVVLAAAVPPSVARPARIGSHTSVADCGFDVRAGEDGAIKTANICLTGTQPDTGLLTATESSSDACVGNPGGGLLVRGSSTDVIVGVGGAKPCGAELLFTPLASESAFLQEAFAAGSRARSTVSFDD